MELAAGSIETTLFGALALGTRYLVAAVFALASLHKLRTRLEFAGVIYQYRLTPKGSEHWLSWLIPSLELSIAVALFVLPQVGALLAAGLIASYCIAIGVNLLRGRHHIDCGCGGASTPLSGALVWRNLLLISLLTASFVTTGSTQLPIWAMALAATLAAAMGALYLCFNQLQTNRGIYRRLWLGEQVG